jgi:ATP-dependent DNA ligase
MPARKRKAAFVEPMLLLRAENLPEGDAWQYELKFDGYRALAIKTGGKIQLRSRNDHDFSRRYPAIAMALSSLPNETVVDGEVVALDQSGKPSFNTLQNHAASADVHFFVFDVLILAGRDVMREPLTKRRELMERHIVPKLSEPIRYAPPLDARLSDLVHSVKAQGLEGLVAKRRDSRYEPGERSGAWLKMRVNRGQEFVIGGYTIGGATFDGAMFTDILGFRERVLAIRGSPKRPIDHRVRLQRCSTCSAHGTHARSVFRRPHRGDTSARTVVGTA